MTCLMRASRSITFILCTVSDSVCSDLLRYGEGQPLTNEADFRAVDWKALASTIPAMFALTFFGVLHVPINVPALGFSTGVDNVDVDRELIAHGVSNALSGFCGSIQVSFSHFCPSPHRINF